MCARNMVDSVVCLRFIDEIVNHPWGAKEGGGDVKSIKVDICSFYKNM